MSLFIVCSFLFLLRQPYSTSLLMPNLGNFQYYETFTILSLLNGVQCKRSLPLYHRKCALILVTSLSFKLYKNCIISNKICPILLVRHSHKASNTTLEMDSPSRFNPFSTNKNRQKIQCESRQSNHISYHVSYCNLCFSKNKIIKYFPFVYSFIYPFV